MSEDPNYVEYTTAVAARTTTGFTLGFTERRLSEDPGPSSVDTRPLWRSIRWTAIGYIAGI